MVLRLSAEWTSERTGRGTTYVIFEFTAASLSLSMQNMTISNAMSIQVRATIRAITIRWKKRSGASQHPPGLVPHVVGALHLGLASSLVMVRPLRFLA